MARYSTPVTRAYARDKAAVIGAAERVIYGELTDLGMRVVHHKATTVVIVVAAFLFLGLVVGLVESVNL